MTEDKMVGWYHQLSGHEFEQALGVGDGQGSLACCSPWGHKESDMTEGHNIIFFLNILAKYARMKIRLLPKARKQTPKELEGIHSTNARDIIGKHHNSPSAE